nr:hypothetical protein [Tanacetum cinerariifolium]
MTHDKNQELYDALLISIMLDDAIASRDVNPYKVLRKRDCGDDQDPTAGSNQGKKKKRKGKYYEPSKDKVLTGSPLKGKTQSKPSSTNKPVNAKEPLHEGEMEVEEPTLDDVVNEADQPQDDVVPTQGTQFEQPWFNDLVYVEKDPLTFDELMATLIEFSKFAMNRLKLDKITKADLVGPVYKLLKGTYKSSIELECPYVLSKPLPLQGSPGHLTIPVDFFFNNDLEYLRTGNSERKCTISITKIKATRYELQFIKEMIPNIWIPVKVAYDKDVARGISHWGPKRQLFNRSHINRFSKHDIYFIMKILSVVSVKVDKQFRYGYLQEKVVRRADQKLYVQRRVEHVQLGVESYQKKLNVTPPQKEFPGISAKESYTTSYDLKGVVYLNSGKRKRLIVILLSIHSDDGNPTRANIKQALRQ